MSLVKRGSSYKPVRTYNEAEKADSSIIPKIASVGKTYVNIGTARRAGQDRKLAETELLTKPQFQYSWEGQEEGQKDISMIVPKKDLNWHKYHYGKYTDTHEIRPELIGSKIQVNQANIPKDWIGEDWTYEKMAKHLSTHGISDEDVEAFTGIKAGEKIKETKILEAEKIPFKKEELIKGKQYDKIVPDKSPKELAKHTTLYKDLPYTESPEGQWDWKGFRDERQPVNLGKTQFKYGMRTDDLIEKPGIIPNTASAPSGQWDMEGFRSDYLTNRADVNLGAKRPIVPLSSTDDPLSMEVPKLEKSPDKFTEYLENIQNQREKWRMERLSERGYKAPAKLKREGEPLRNLIRNLRNKDDERVFKNLKNRFIPQKGIAQRPGMQVAKALGNIGKGGMKGLVAGPASSTGLLAGMGPAGWTMMGLNLLGLNPMEKLFKPHTLLGKLFG